MFVFVFVRALMCMTVFVRGFFVCAFIVSPSGLLQGRYDMNHVALLQAVTLDW